MNGLGRGVCIHTHTHTMGYYSAIKKNEIMPFIATWMQLEILILNKSERERKYHILLVCEIQNMAQMSPSTKPK